MRRRKESKVKRTWEEKQQDWMEYWRINRISFGIAILFWLIVLVGLVLCFCFVPLKYEQYEAEAKELESQINVSALIKEDSGGQIRQSKWEKKVIPKDLKIRIKSSEYRVTLIVHIIKRYNKQVIHCITNNAELCTIKCFFEYTVIIALVLWMLLSIPIYYVLCFSIFLFTEVMSRLEKRRKP